MMLPPKQTYRNLKAEKSFQLLSIVFWVVTIAIGYHIAYAPMVYIFPTLPVDKPLFIALLACLVSVQLGMSVGYRQMKGKPVNAKWLLILTILSAAALPIELLLITVALLIWFLTLPSAIVMILHHLNRYIRIVR